MGTVYFWDPVRIFLYKKISSFYFVLTKYHLRYFAAQSGLTWILGFSAAASGPTSPFPFTFIEVTVGGMGGFRGSGVCVFKLCPFFVEVVKSGKLRKTELLGKIFLPISSSILSSVRESNPNFEASNPNLAGDTILKVGGWWCPYSKVNFVVVGEKFSPL